MLDLIVAKAMAKLLEDRYQTVKELADDLREVRRQMDSSRPAAALKASNVPTPPKKPASILGTPAVDTSTIPVAPRDERAKEEEKPVPLAKTFDSFDATLRLAAMTDQTEDFREYISQTQKMRAYKGRIEGPLGAKMQQPPPEAPPPPAPEERKPTARLATPRPMNLPGPQPQPASGGTTSNLIAIAAIVVLSVAAVALTIALVVK
jgi:serine/threonine-protein kinase